MFEKTIHDTLSAIFAAGPYYEVTYAGDPRVMTIHTDEPKTPAAVVVMPMGSTFAMPALQRRGLAPERTSWTWHVTVQFSSSVVSLEQFEVDRMAVPISIPAPAGSDPREVHSLLAIIRSVEYNHPPQQSPSSGTKAEFTVEILPQSLRK